MCKYLYICVALLYATVGMGTQRVVNRGDFGVGIEGDSLAGKALQDTITLCNFYDTVLVENGNYYVKGAGINGLAMKDSVILTSRNGAPACTLTGSNTAYHVIYYNYTYGHNTSHDAVIDGFTIMSGKANGSYPHNKGGGIYCYSASPIIKNNKITNNSASSGGSGIYIEYGSPIIDNNTITNNSGSYYGGGIYPYNTGQALIKNNTITYNSASTGGSGIYCEHASPIIDNNTITNNSAGIYGGGIYCDYGASPTISGNTIASNSATYGGGISCYYSSSPTIRNNTIANNSASYGSGIYSSTYCISLIDSNTITGNSASTNGGGIYSDDSCHIRNTVIINNSAVSGGGGIYLYSGGNKFKLPIVNSTIAKNTANDGGGIYCKGAGYYSGVSLTLTRSLIAVNYARRAGGAFCSMDSGKLFVDSSFIVDNGAIDSTKSGLAYLYNSADTLKISYSHTYYNTYQPDTEIDNNTSTTIPIKNNFWWDTTEAQISALIDGSNDHSGWVKNFISGVPGEPTSVSSVQNYSNNYSTIVDSIGSDPDTLYLQVTGTDRLASLREAAVVLVKSKVYSNGIAVALVETDTNSGIYQGKVTVKITQAPNDTIRRDEIRQTIRVKSIGDTLQIVANVNTAKRDTVWYRLPPPHGICESYNTAAPTLVFSKLAPNPLTDASVLTYVLPKNAIVSIKVYNIVGKLIDVLVNKVQSANSYTIKWDSSKLAQGVYFIRIEVGRFTKIHKVVKIK